MNHRIKISADSLQNESRKISELVSKAEKELTKIYSEVETLNAMWDGPANETFIQQFIQDYEMFKQTCNFLRRFTEDMGRAADEYNRCENSVWNTVKSISV